MTTNALEKHNGNMTTLASPPALNYAVLDQVIGTGDIQKLTPQERVAYYRSVCESTGLNPMTSPFEYVVLSGKMRLYATRGATDQLRFIHKVSITQLETEARDGLYIVTAHARSGDGRTDSSTGAVPFGNLQGEARANAIMKAETKAKRRVTLSICGLGWLDETEIDSVPGAQTVRVDHSTGEVLDTPAPRLTRDGTPRDERTLPQERTPPPNHSPENLSCEVCGKALTRGQATISFNKFGRTLCPAHQRGDGGRGSAVPADAAEREAMRPSNGEETDPFADDAPQDDAPPLLDVPQEAPEGPGHGD